MESEDIIKNEPLTLQDIIETKDQEKIHDYFSKLSASEIVYELSHIRQESRIELLSMLDPAEAAEIIDDIPYVQAVDILGDMDSGEAAAIIKELDSDDQADILSDVEDEMAEAIMGELNKEEALKLRKLISYEQDTAGGLMITEFLAFDQGMTVGDVAKHLQENSQEYEKYNVQYIYVTDKKGKFKGVLQMRSLLLSKPSTKLSEIVIQNTMTVLVTASIQELISFFDTYDFYGVPVLDQQGVMLGIVLRKHVREEQSEMSNMELLETQGIVGGEELRTMPILLRSRRRLSWLSVNIILNIIAASVIAIYQETLSAVIALAVFLPVISDMSGCSGNQAVAVSLRELSLGVVKPFEVLRVWWQEVSVGLINGTILGSLITLAAWLWKGNIYLGVVAGGALAINTVVAVSIGGTIPLILKRYNVDPALASGPILTTITDMLGFFLALTFAGLLMNYLV